MRLATYNIRNGGQDGPDSTRLEHAVTVINRIAPDVLAIQEANGFGSNRRAILHDVESATGMRGYLCRTNSGFDVALFVRPPLTVVRSGFARAGFTHGAVYVDIHQNEGPPLRIINTHLSPFDGDQRLTEIRRLLRRVAVVGRVILMGDLNSLDSQDDMASVDELNPRDRGRYLVPGTSDTIDTRVIDELASAGLIDLGNVSGAPGRLPTTPTTHGGGKEFHRMRLDRIFATPDVAKAVRSAVVARRPPADSASDHYPVVLDLAI